VSWFIRFRYDVGIALQKDVARAEKAETKTTKLVESARP
jgi:hypothetical protein